MEKDLQFIDHNSFQQLKILYDKLYQENISLKSQTPPTPQISIPSLRQSFGEELETLTEVLSNTLQSIQFLQKYKSELISSRNSAKKDLEVQRDFQDFSKDSKIFNLSSKLTSTIETLKTVTMDKNILDGVLERTETTKYVSQGQNQALEEKLRILEGKNKEIMNKAQLTSLLEKVESKQEVLKHRIEKYELYIQSKQKRC